VKRTYCIASFSDGTLRLFPSEKAAVAYQTEHRLIVDTITSPEGQHYRGPAPRRGVAFTDEDQSTRQIYAAMANR
jgi:hypothetical protein